MKTQKNTAGRVAKRREKIQIDRIIQRSSENCKLISEKVQFAGQELIVATRNDQHYVAMRPLVQALGLGWSRQARKLQHGNRYDCVLMSTLAEDGRQRDMLFIPLQKLNGWLFSVNAERCRRTVRERLKLYQNECFLTLYNYFQCGYAVNPRATAPQLDFLVEHVEKLQYELGYQKHRLELFDAIVECGTISKATDNPRIVPVRGTYRSLPRRKNKKLGNAGRQLNFLQKLFSR